MRISSLAILASVAGGLLCIGSASQAATISAEGPFTIEYFGNPEFPDDYYKPPLEFQGSVVVRENRVADFEFTVFDRTWTEADVRHCDCRTNFSPVSGEIEPEVFAFEWSDGEDRWELLWVFDIHHHGDDIFKFEYGVDGFGMNGDSQGDAGRAGGRLGFFPRVNVPEPGTLALLGIGLIGLAVARRKRR